MRQPKCLCFDLILYCEASSARRIPCIVLLARLKSSAALIFILQSHAIRTCMHSSASDDDVQFPNGEPAPLSNEHRPIHGYQHFCTEVPSCSYQRRGAPNKNKADGNCTASRQPMHFCAKSTTKCHLFLAPCLRISMMSTFSLSLKIENQYCHNVDYDMR